MASKKKYNIAIAGTFDVENYGDLLFPVIFEKAMQKRGLDFDLVMFSPSLSAKKALDDSKIVYSYRDFERINAEKKFDALVVGGGAILHFKDIKVKLPGEDHYSDYHNVDSWYTLIYLAVKNGIKVLYNVPQAPFPFDSYLTPIAKSAFLSSEYISVRDDFSKEFIDDLFKNEKAPDIKVFPDSICSISNYYKKKELVKKAREILGFNDEYAVVHFAVSMPEEAEEPLVDAINKIKGQGYRVVFLPLGYTHGDDVAMNRLNKKYGLSCYTFTHKLSIDEMTAILAGCNLYVGTSFHGSVVSISFGNMAISYNYYAPMLKNVDNYKRLGVSQYLAENYKELNPVLDRLLKKKNYKTNITAIKKQAEHHFDNLYKHIIGQTKPLSYENQMLESLLDTISNASLEIEKSKAESEDMLKKYKELNTTYESIISSRSYKLLQKIAKIKSTLKK